MRSLVLGVLASAPCLLACDFADETESSLDFEERSTSVQSICRGESELIASFESYTGSVIDICLEPGGDFGVAEFGVGDFDSAAVDAAKYDWKCPIDVFLALADDGVAVPERLLTTCSTQHRSIDVDRAVDEETPSPHPRPWEDASRVPRTTNFCGSNGQSAWINEHCDPVDMTGRNGPFGPNATYCSTSPYKKNTWCSSGLSEYGEYKKKTATSFMNTAGDFAEAHVASCGGSTEFKARRKNANVGSWQNVAVFDVPPNSWGWYWMGNSGSADDDFRFRIDARSNARFRYNGGFCDEEWP